MRAPGSTSSWRWRRRWWWRDVGVFSGGGGGTRCSTVSLVGRGRCLCTTTRRWARHLTLLAFGAPQVDGAGRLRKFLASAWRRGSTRLASNWRPGTPALRNSRACRGGLSWALALGMLHSGGGGRRRQRRCSSTLHLGTLPLFLPLPLLSLALLTLPRALFCLILLSPWL